MSFKNTSEKEVGKFIARKQKIISKKNNRGFSLVELMLVIGMLGGLSLIVMNITQQSTKSSAKYQFDSEVMLITNEINGILSDPNKCLTTFTNATQAATPATPVLNATPANVTNPSGIAGTPSTIRRYTLAGGPYGNGGVMIASYSLNLAATPDPLLTIDFQKKAILGTGTIPKTIKLYVEKNGSGVITLCRSISTASVDIWSRGTGSQIYYSGGDVGIGTTNPSTKLHVVGNLQVTGTIDATGTITSASDKRLKKDFNSLDGSLEKILSLRGVVFSWRDQSLGKGRQIGFIAQELEKIYPELVYANSKGMKSVAYQNLVAPLVEAIREQQTEIETLKTVLCENNPNLKFCDKR